MTGLCNLGKCRVARGKKKLVKKERILTNLISKRRKFVGDGYSYRTEWSLTRLTVALWQGVSTENGDMRRERYDIYIGSAWKTKRRSDLGKNLIKEWHVSCIIIASDNLSRMGTVHFVLFENRQPIGLWTVNPRILNRHPIGPSTQAWRTHKVKGANEGVKIWYDGPSLNWAWRI